MSRFRSVEGVSGVWEPGEDRDGARPHPPERRGRRDGSGPRHHCHLPSSVRGVFEGLNYSWKSGRGTFCLTSNVDQILLFVDKSIVIT